MMAHPKPLASLSSGLLARKGHAKPAMRPQGFAGHGPGDDLGWNDMGSARAAPVEAEVPPVLVQRRQLERIAPAAGHRAAFTLRLDHDRHLRLRLASAVAGLSAQRLVERALDDLLTTMPQVEDLARQVPAGATRRTSGEKPR